MNLRFDNKGYIQFIALLVLVLAVLGIQAPVVENLIQVWFPGDGFSKKPAFWLLVAGFVIYTVNRKALLSTKSSPAHMIVFVTLLGSLSLFESFFPFYGLVFLLSGLWFYLVLPDRYSTVFVSAGLMAFSLPYFLEITPYLQNLAVYAIETSLNVIGVPVLVQEYSIALRHGQLVVEESCSGKGYLANNLTLMFLYSYLSRYNIRQFILAALVAIALGLLVNWARVVLISIVAHYHGLDVPFFVKGHATLGWVMYCIMLLPFFMLLLKIDRMEMRTSGWMKWMVTDMVNVPPILWFVTVLLYASIFR